MPDRKNQTRSDVSSPASAETARQEGAQGRTGKAPGDVVHDGEVDASDPNMRQKIDSEIAEVADQVHAKA